MKNARKYFIQSSNHAYKRNLDIWRIWGDNNEGIISRWFCVYSCLQWRISRSLHYVRKFRIFVKVSGIESHGRKYLTSKFYAVDFDKIESDVAEKYKLFQYPTFFVVKDGIVVKQTCIQSKERLEMFVEKHTK
jgi:hypothetical protein